MWQGLLVLLWLRVFYWHWLVSTEAYIGVGLKADLHELLYFGLGFSVTSKANDYGT